MKAEDSRYEKKNAKQKGKKIRKKRQNFKFLQKKKLL